MQVSSNLIGKLSSISRIFVIVKDEQEGGPLFTIQSKIFEKSLLKSEGAMFITPRVAFSSKV